MKDKNTYDGQNREDEGRERDEWSQGKRLDSDR